MYFTTGFPACLINDGSTFNALSSPNSFNFHGRNFLQTLLNPLLSLIFSLSLRELLRSGLSRSLAHSLASREGGFSEAFSQSRPTKMSRSTYLAACARTAGANQRQRTSHNRARREQHSQKAVAALFQGMHFLKARPSRDCRKSNASSSFFSSHLAPAPPHKTPLRKTYLRGIVWRATIYPGNSESTDMAERN